MRQNYLFIINPIAGNGNRKMFKKAFTHWQAQTKHLFDIYETTGKNDTNVLKELISKKKPTVLAAVGGDGTLLLAAKLARTHNLKVAFFPQGSANGMAVELALPNEENLQFKLLERPKFKAVDMLLFNGQHWGLHISDLGLNAAMVKEYESVSNRGFLGYSQGLLRALPKFEPFEVEVKNGNSTSYHTCLMVAFGNARKYGTGASLNSIGKIGDGKFELCLLHKLNAVQIAQHYFNLEAESSENFTLLQYQRVEIKTRKPQPFQIDGEPLGELNELTIEVYPQAIKMIVP